MTSAPEQNCSDVHIKELAGILKDHVMNMEIAGLNFAIRCHHPLSAKGLANGYGQFINKPIPPGHDTGINVRIVIGNLPDTRQMKRIFDTGSSWSMYIWDNNYVISLTLPTCNNQTIWLATFNMHFDSISIYCGDLLVHEADGHITVTNPMSYPLDQLLIMYILAGKGGALLHAAGLSINGRGYIFPGRSGAGKSTLSRLFLGKDNVRMLSDDRIIVRNINSTFKAFGTPWAGDANIAENRGSNLNGIFFIHHAETTMAKELTPKEAFERLMPITSIPWYDEEAMQRIFAFCEDMVLAVPAYELHFRPDNEVTTFFEDFIAGNNAR